jgi:hypothetical protein
VLHGKSIVRRQEKRRGDGRAFSRPELVKERVGMGNKEGILYTDQNHLLKYAISCESILHQ